VNRPAGPQGYPAIPGPSDRVLFAEMQARQRRTARWYGALGAIAVAAAGLPVSLVVTPLLFLVLLVGLRVSAATGSAPPTGLLLAEQITTTVRAALATAFRGEWPSVDPRTATLLLLPGAAAMAILWIVVRRILAPSGAGGSLALQARELTPGDFEEYQLQNVIGEMAIAVGAGGTPPRVRLIGSVAANAAATGLRRDDATIVVTRGLLDRLDREETQGIVGHLVASIANDDLAVATLLLSVQQTLGLLTTILNVPFGPQSRRMLRTLLRPKTTADRMAVADQLAMAGMNTDDDISRWMMRLGGTAWPIRILPRLPFFPFFLVAITARMAATFVTGGLVGWVFAALWRRRRRVADAMGVELTRNPDALARGLGRLVEGEHRIEGAEASAHLFVAWLPDPSGKHRLSLVFGGVGTLSPSIAKRREALRRMGAGSVSKANRRWGWADVFRGPSRALVVLLPTVVVVVAVGGVMMLTLMVAINLFVLGLLIVGVDWAIDVLINLARWA
jgi:Zn-dependent protease with chaperone function